MANSVGDVVTDPGSGDICVNCSYYNEIEAPNFDAPGEETGIFPGRGQCMYYPPKIIFDLNEGKKESIRPAVHGFDWCGFFKLERVADIGGDENGK